MAVSHDVSRVPGPPAWLTWLAFILVFIGALNWALVGLFSFNLVGAIFGGLSTVSRIIYVLVGLAALYLLAVWPRLSRRSRLA